MNSDNEQSSPVEPERESQLARAREIYMNYDGSRFYMSRDGHVEWEYRDYQVPDELEAQWRDELVAAKIAKLAKPGNWSALNYLCHHSNTGHLPDVASAEPLGELWQRISFLEMAVQYIERCKGHYPRREIRAALKTVHAQIQAVDIDAAPAAEREGREGREEMLRGRLRKVDATANLLLSRTRFIRRQWIRLRWALTKPKGR